MEDLIYKCKYCGKICKNKNSQAQHEVRCKSNPNRIDVNQSTKNLLAYIHKLKTGELKKINTNQYTKAKNLGLPKPEISQETREKLSARSAARKHSLETIDKISNSMKKAVREHPESYSASNVNGRVKKVAYKDHILDSSWEVEVAKFLDSYDIRWEKPTTGFDYIYDGKTHIYYPDFYLPDFNTYIEVKGYKRKRDLAKWSSVQNLIVIGKKEILDIKAGTYKLPESIRYINNVL